MIVDFPPDFWNVVIATILVVDIKLLCYINKRLRIESIKQKKIVDGINNICLCWKCALNRTVKENERLGIFRKPSLKKGGNKNGNDRKAGYSYD